MSKCTVLPFTQVERGINGEGSFNDGFILLLNVYFEDWVSDIYVMIFFLKINK